MKDWYIKKKERERRLRSWIKKGIEEWEKTERKKRVIERKRERDFEIGKREKKKKGGFIFWEFEKKRVERKRRIRRKEESKRKRSIVKEDVWKWKR